MGMQMPGNQGTQQGAAQPPQPAGSPAPQQGGGQNANQPDILSRRNWNYPRWPLLASLILIPCIVIGYISSVVGKERPCYLGSLCMLDTQPAIVQIALIWFTFGLFWLLAIVFGGSRLEGTKPRGPLSSLLWQLSNFERIRGLLLWSGVAALFLILVTFVVGRITIPGFASAMLVVFVAIILLLWRPPEQLIANHPRQGPFRQLAQRAGSSWYILRNLVPFRYIIPNRAPAPQAPNVTAPPAPAAQPTQAPPAQQPNVPPPTLGGNLGP